MSKYLDQFINTQILGLNVSHQNMTRRVWETYLDDFVLGLNLECSGLVLDEALVRNKYKELITPLADIAGNMGFNTHWSYNSL